MSSLKYPSLVGLCLLGFGRGHASSPIYQLPSVGVTAEPPFLYQVSPQLGNQVIISHSQIVRSGANNIGQIINNIAGVQYISGLSAEPQILIHAEPALILVDGQPLTNFSMSNPDVNLIPIAEIDKIIITPSVAGTIYGNQSLGGVINIITKPTMTPEQTISILVGSPWMNQIVGVSGGPINQDAAYRADVQNQFNQGYRNNSEEDMGRGGVSLQRNYDTGSVLLRTDVMRQTEDYPGFLTDIQVAQNQKQSFADQGQGDYQANTGLLSLNWIQDLHELWQLKTNISDRAETANSNLDGAFSQNYNTLILNPELSGRFSLQDKPIQAMLGLMFSNENYSLASPSFFANINGARQQQYSTYGSLNLPLSRNLSVAASGRLLAIETQGQFFNTTTFEFNPESSQSQNLALATIALNEQINKETTLYVRRAMGYQLPFIDESNFTANINTGFGLQATTSTSYESGITWKGARLQWDMEAFLTNIDNAIGFFIPPDGIAANYNLAPTRSQGVTGGASYQASQKWTLGTSLTLMNNYFLEGTYVGSKTPGAADILADLNARYQLNSIWSIYAESQYVGPEFAEGDNANVSSEIPGYWIENLAVNAEFSSWLLSFRIDNLSNTLNYLATVYDPYITEPHNNPVAYYPAAGRTAIVSLTYHFL